MQPPDGPQSDAQPQGLPKAACPNHRLLRWFACAGLLMITCNPTSQSSCPQSVARAPVGWDTPLGGLLLTSETTRCTMQLRLMNESSTGFTARLETAAHCTDTHGLIPASATLGVYVDDGYAQGIPFTAGFAAALTTFRQIAQSQGPGPEALVDWGLLPIATPGGTSRQASGGQTLGQAPHEEFEKNLLMYRSGCPTSLGNGKTLCATAADLLLETIFIDRTDLERTRLADGSNLAELFRRRLPAHQKLLAAEIRLQQDSGGSPASQAAHLLGAVQRRNDLERLQQILPLLNVSATCAEIGAANPDEILSGTGNSSSGTNSLLTAYGERLRSQTGRARAILNFCSEGNRPIASQLQTALDAVVISGGRTLAELRSDFPKMTLSESDLEDQSAAAIEELRQKWQAIEGHLAGNLAQYAYATNAPAALAASPTFSASVGSTTPDPHFHHHPLTALIKDNGESQALLRDEKNFGPVFTAKTLDDFVVPWNKGSSGTVFSFQSGGVSVPLAALTAFDDSYSSGGVAVLPLPRSRTTSDSQNNLSPEDGNSPETQPSTTTSADLDAKAAQREGVRNTAAQGTCF